MNRREVIAGMGAAALAAAVPAVPATGRWVDLVEIHSDAHGAWFAPRHLADDIRAALLRPDARIVWFDSVSPLDTSDRPSPAVDGEPPGPAGVDPAGLRRAEILPADRANDPLGDGADRLPGPRHVRGASLNRHPSHADNLRVGGEQCRSLRATETFHREGEEKFFPAGA